MRALTLLTVFSSGIVMGIGLAIGSATYLRARTRLTAIRPPATPARVTRVRVEPATQGARRDAFAGLAESPGDHRPVADLADIPIEPYDPDEAVELAEEPTLYEEDDLGPHLIEPRIGEEEPESAGLPRRPTSRPGATRRSEA